MTSSHLATKYFYSDSSNKIHTIDSATNLELELTSILYEKPRLMRSSLTTQQFTFVVTGYHYGVADFSGPALTITYIAVSNGEVVAAGFVNSS